MNVLVFRQASKWVSRCMRCNGWTTFSTWREALDHAREVHGMCSERCGWCQETATEKRVVHDGKPYCAGPRVSVSGRQVAYRWDALTCYDRALRAGLRLQQFKATVREVLTEKEVRHMLLTAVDVACEGMRDPRVFDGWARSVTATLHMYGQPEIREQMRNPPKAGIDTGADWDELHERLAEMDGKKS